MTLVTSFSLEELQRLARLPHVIVAAATAKDAALEQAQTSWARSEHPNPFWACCTSCDVWTHVASNGCYWLHGEYISRADLPGWDGWMLPPDLIADLRGWLEAIHAHEAVAR